MPTTARPSRRRPLLILLVGALAAAFVATFLQVRPQSSAVTGGCGADPALASGTHQIQSGGTNREFVLSVPDNYDNNRSYRLVFAFHPRGGTAASIDVDGGPPGTYYGLEALSDNDTIFVAPQGLDGGWANPGDRDVTFVDDMINLIDAGLCVDTERRFSVGFSFGGAMSYALACARPTVFRAVAVYGAGVVSGCSGGAEPVAYMGIHGIVDNILDISGGRAMRDTFVTNNGCTPQDAPEPAVGSLTHTVTTYSGCQGGKPVVWAAFDGGHTPSPVDGSGSLFEPIANSYTRPLVWDFFTQF